MYKESKSPIHKYQSQYATLVRVGELCCSYRSPPCEITIEESVKYFVSWQLTHPNFPASPILARGPSVLEGSAMSVEKNNFCPKRANARSSAMRLNRLVGLGV